ncbi:U3 small nucleolar RNA-associated protein 11 [Westerdykella ornata]|uniref:U3 small nucleolar RNA-associated protein 11 n=1 Tax=Westerdykella ornata TaxID=318751 RepID=A0A6A6JMV4_WESOR|nr:U3 small nucleolar RNA-associated protein 11 [Westerdykella ornata]KAF2277832.1 U3 small nucleolar RNA-associated protein 11 [Westerdykella ornata]
MSSMRNAVQRRNHKERAQPLEREKWGLLEKKKDYKLRAADHKEKKKRLKLLKQKALERNPDEFSFGMMSSKVDSAGRKIADRGNKPLSMEVVKLLKTQDAGYIRTMLQMVRKERQKLEEKILLEGKQVVPLGREHEGKRAGHTVFVEGKEEQRKFKPDDWFGKGGEWPDREKRQRKARDDAEEEEEEEEKPKKLTKKQLEAKLREEKEKRALQKRRERTQERMEIHLEAVKKRERELMAAEQELEMQRAKMNGSVGGVNKDGVKFKIRQRKK